MTKLELKARRDLFQMKWRALAIIATLASAVGVFAGVYMAIESILWTRDSEFERLHFADLEVRFVPEDAKNLPDVADIPGVASVERRLVFPGAIRTPEGKRLMAVMNFLETGSPGIHSFEIVDGEAFSRDATEEVVIEQSLATYHGYRPGDRLEVEIGEKVHRSRIVGVVISPEYFVSTSNPDYFVPERGSLGVVYGSLDEVTDSLGFVLVNDLLFAFEPGADPVAVKQEVLRRLSKLTFDQVMTRDQQFSSKYLETQVRAIGFFTPAMVIVLLMLALVITLVNFNRMVAAERREIGALLALGYQRKTLIATYVEAGLLLGFAGSALGAGASLLFRNVFAQLFASSMGIPLVLTRINLGTMAVAMLCGLAIAAISAALPILGVVRSSPQALMRGNLRRTAPSFRLRAARLSEFLGLPAYARFGLRNVMRHQGRTVATIGSIALALGVACAYRLSINSIDETLIQRFQRDSWQLMADFLHPVYSEDLDSIRAMPGVESLYPFLRRYVEVEKDGVVEDATLLGIRERDAVIGLNIAMGRGPSEAEGSQEVVLSLGLARKLEAAVGDVIEFHALGESYDVTVVGISSDVPTALALVRFEFAQEVCQLREKVSGVYVKADNAAAAPALEDDLRALGYVGKILPKAELLEQSRKVLYVMIGVLNVAAAVSIFLAALFILTSINLSLLETESEFATLKAIGYGSRWIRRIVLSETAVYAAGALLLSVPFGALISVYLNGRMGQAWFRIDDFFSPVAYATILIPALLLLPLGAYPAMRHIINMPVSESLGTRVIE